ncbi:MAG: tetratricopeptide repeat protein [Nitrospirota bacterium]|nr:tetratricopeptide repeat protein [Nitrospirota bacterium]
MHKFLAMVCLILLAAGCAGPVRNPTTATLTLKAPAGSSAAAATAVEEGNKLFAQTQWEQAKAQYETAIKVEPTLAEAHYDLALTLERLGNKKEATVHYKEAANLAPGNQIIWNAPPFRRYSNEGGPLSKDKAYMDPKPY